jgi:hypothetical protein
MAPRTAATIFPTRVGIALPTIAKRGPKETYPFDSLAAPAPVFQIETIKDGKGKDKLDAAGNVQYAQNEDGSWKLAVDANGLPIPVMDGDKQAMNYASFAVNGRSKKQVGSTIFTAEERYIGTPAKITVDGKEVANKTREFVAVEVDPTTDPDGATIRVFRTK